MSNLVGITRSCENCEFFGANQAVRFEGFETDKALGAIVSVVLRNDKIVAASNVASVSEESIPELIDNFKNCSGLVDGAYSDLGSFICKALIDMNNDNSNFSTKAVDHTKIFRVLGKNRRNRS